MTTRPEGYESIPAHEDAIEEARSIKEAQGWSWNEYLDRSAEALRDD